MGICSGLSFYTVPMDLSSAFVAATGGEHSPSKHFSFGETIRFGSLEFIANWLSNLSLSPLGGGSGAIITGPTRGEPPLL
jgi:hypothetical protein